jgi:hypothetical protein
MKPGKVMFQMKDQVPGFMTVISLAFFGQAEITEMRDGTCRQAASSRWKADFAK